MRSSPVLQSFATRLIERYDTQFIQCAGERRLYLQRDGFPTLNIVIAPQTVSLSLEEIWDGEPYLNPEVLFYTATHEWTPIYSNRPPLTTTMPDLTGRMAT